MKGKVTAIIIILATLAGCASSADSDAKSLLETLEFEENEYGTIRATGDITVGNIPFFSSKIHVDYQKSKDAPSSDANIE